MKSEVFFSFKNLVDKLSSIQLHKAAEISLYYYDNKFDDSFLRDLVFSTVISNKDTTNLISKISKIASLSDEEIAMQEYKNRRIDYSGKSTLSFLLMALDKETLSLIFKYVKKTAILSQANCLKEALENTISNINYDPYHPYLKSTLEKLIPQPDTAESWEYVTPNIQ